MGCLTTLIKTPVNLFCCAVNLLCCILSVICLLPLIAVAIAALVYYLSDPVAIEINSLATSKCSLSLKNPNSFGGDSTGYVLDIFNQDRNVAKGLFPSGIDFPQNKWVNITLDITPVSQDYILCQGRSTENLKFKVGYYVPLGIQKGTEIDQQVMCSQTIPSTSTNITQ